MPTKRECIEDMLAQVEEEFHRVLTHDSYPNFFGGRATIAYSSARPELKVEIKELGKPGPKRGSKFRKRIGPSKKVLQAFNEHEDTEEF